MLTFSFDVWLGNIRGNKYSREHTQFKDSQDEFWSFDLDDVIKYDMPAFVDGVLLNYKCGQKLKILGFSQGTTITLGFLSKYPQFHSRIDTAVMLAATGRPKTLPNINFISNLEPELIKSIFGHKALLEEIITFLNAFLPPSIYSRMLKTSMKTLFNWKFTCLSSQNHIYSHLYCSTSVSLVQHWFHIINQNEFVHNKSAVRYKLQNIPSDKIRLFFGQQDTLEDKEYLLGQIDGANKFHVIIPEYEHLDFLWSPQNPERLYPQVLQVLNRMK